LGGTEDVFSGGAADTTQVYGSEVVSSAGSGYSDTVQSGGVFRVASGGFVSGGLTISGGTAAISGAVASGQEVLFAGQGDLAFYDLAAFDATIGGYSTGDEFDLGGFKFGAGETRSYANGTLTVVDGAKTATLSLLGSYVTSDFALSADGQGGTFVKFV
jgi:autotransporter passenger strand-loop-strand repeat protein